MKRLMVLVLTAMAACAPQPETAQPAPPVQREAATHALPAPAPSDVTLRIGAQQAGQTISVPVGQRFAIELVGIPTAGYVWEPVAMPAFITRAGEASGPTNSAQNQPGFAGGSHWEVFLFAAQSAGSGEIRLEMRRPWETNEPPSATFAVTIEAH